MTLRRSLLALGALGSAVALPGCVAAVIPLAAGALMASSGELDGDDDAPPVASTEPSKPATFAEAFELESAAVVTVRALPEPTPTAPAKPGPVPATAALEVPATGTRSFTTGPLPAPTPGRDRIVEDFLHHALAQTDRNPSLAPRQSALLAAPDALRPERTDCGSKPPAVILDLDPGKESFDPLTPATGNPALAAALAELREREVTVFWASHLGEGFAEALRAVLGETGLDPQGQDRLLLLRSLDQRKHTQRTEIAQTHCVVAMLGDERADFDELFYYLRQPETALRLDAMLGSGWFLADPLPGPVIGEEAEARGEPQP